MKSEDRFGMRPLWDSLLSIYKEFAKICKRHNLQYFMMEGNMIGAVRHNGFIPWDDDLDVAMPRPDYEKFISICKKELPSYLKFVDWNNTPELPLAFGKIQETRENVVRDVEERVGFELSNGLYIDILVIDGCPESKLSQFIFTRKLSLYEAMFRSKLRKYSEETKKGRYLWLLGRILSVFAPWLTIDVLRKRMDRLIKSVPFGSTRLTWRTGAVVRMRWIFSVDIWRGTEMVEFDELLVPLPKGWREYLTVQYGDYMKMPPIEKQVPSHSYSHRCPWWLGPTHLESDAR